MSIGEWHTAARLGVTGSRDMANRQQGYLAGETVRNSELSAENHKEKRGNLRAKNEVVMN